MFLLTSSSVTLMEPVVKYLLLHPHPPSHLPALAGHLHSSSTLLVSQTPVAPPYLLGLLVRLLPFQPSSHMEQLLFVASCACTLAPLHPRLSLAIRQGTAQDLGSYTRPPSKLQFHKDGPKVQWAIPRYLGLCKELLCTGTGLMWWKATLSVAFVANLLRRSQMSHTLNNIEL